ncbi:MAG: YraN family protein, partial [Pseudomonadota bacterium]
MTGKPGFGSRDPTEPRGDRRRQERKAAFRLGLRAETLAAWYLRLKGYRILAHRYRTGAGEIDLIARRGDCLCFVEVKARTDVDAALRAVTARSRRRIATAARIWLSACPGHENCAWRFDIIVIQPWRLP